MKPTRTSNRRAASRAVLVGALLPLLGSSPAPGAAGTAVCAITATLRQSATQWSIESGVIDCKGQVGGALITGPGQLTGSGTFGAPPPGGTCARHVAHGMLRYTIPTARQQLRLDEEVVLVAAGGIAFSTPSLTATLAVTGPMDGDCLTTPVTRAGLQGPAALLRPGYV